MFRDAEVQYFDHQRTVAALRKEQIRRLQVTMNDPRRVRLRDRIAGVQDKHHRLLHAQWPYSLEVIFQIAAIEVQQQVRP